MYWDGRVGMAKQFIFAGINLKSSQFGGRENSL